MLYRINHRVKNCFEYVYNYIYKLQYDFYNTRYNSEFKFTDRVFENRRHFSPSKPISLDSLEMEIYF